VLRFRRSRGEERQQLKWFTYAGALVPLAVAGDALPAPVGDLLFAVPVMFLPVATGTAILRYRLYEIDGLINRTLVYGLLTALLGGVPRSPNRTRNKTFTLPECRNVSRRPPWQTLWRGVLEGLEHDVEVAADSRPRSGGRGPGAASPIASARSSCSPAPSKHDRRSDGRS
jgi:hypothetical protein